MPNIHYTKVFDVVPGSFVRSQPVEDEFARVQVGFDSVQTAIDQTLHAPDAIGPFPAQYERANKVMGFDGNGDPVAIGTVADITAASVQAANSASSAATSASAAASSASASAGSASSASGSASSASGSSSSAATSASQALTYRNQAEQFKNEAQSAAGGGVTSVNGFAGPGAVTVTFASLASKPTTLAGYSVTDVPWSLLSGKPTTAGGYGITDVPFSLLSSKPATAAGHGITDVPWGILSGKPTTLAGYGVTDVPWSLLSGKPTTLAGYGITQTALPKVEVTGASFTCSDADQEVLVTSAGACNVTLPATSTVGRRVRISAVNSRLDIKAYIPSGMTAFVLGQAVSAGDYIGLDALSTISVEFEFNGFVYMLRY